HTRFSRDWSSDVCSSDLRSLPERIVIRLPTEPRMPFDRLNDALTQHVTKLEEAGTAKGAETVVVEVIPPAGERGPRFRLQGEGEREFIRMNSNSYLGLSLVPEIIEAEEKATARWGAVPGAVR